MRLAAAALAAIMTASQALAGTWPGGHHAAVVLTYDDALTSQLDIAIPALDAAGLKGTFFLTGSGIAAAQLGRWRAAAAEGHELGNHTLHHPCSRNTYPAPARYTSEAYTVDAMLDEIRTTNTMLTAIDGKTERSFATPCGEHVAGGVDYIPALRESGLVRFVRGVVPYQGKLDPMDAPCLWFSQEMTGAQMIAAVEKAAQSGDLLVLGFHGVGGDHLKVSAEAHAQLVAWLKAHSDTIWVTTFSEAMDYATRHQGG